MNVTVEECDHAAAVMESVATVMVEEGWTSEGKPKQA